MTDSGMEEIRVCGQTEVYFTRSWIDDSDFDKCAPFQYDIQTNKKCAQETNIEDNGGCKSMDTIHTILLDGGLEAKVELKLLEKTEQESGKLYSSLPRLCHICGNHIRHKFKEHLQTHRKKTIKCPSCDKLFNNRACLVSHIKLVHKSKEQKAASLWHCPICNKGLTLLTHLHSHMKIMHFSSTKEVQDTKPVFNSCDRCNKCFKRRSDLDRHVLYVHTDKSARKFACGTCGRNCVTRSDLIKHTRIHTNTRPYACTVCNKTFALIGNLNQHLNTHKKGLEKSTGSAIHKT